MRSASLLLAGSLLTALLAPACASPQGEPAVDDESASLRDPANAFPHEAPAAGVLPAPAVSGARLYFGVPEQDGVTESQPSAWAFAVRAGGTFRLRVAAWDDAGAFDASPQIELQLFRLGLSTGGAKGWALLKVFHGQEGIAELEDVAPAQRTYLVVANAGKASTTLSFDLGCEDPQRFECAVQGQPGDACGGKADGDAACDVGLYCRYPDGTCGNGDAPGRCSKPAEICVMIYRPVCGCDGETYGNVCTASASGANVARDGACEEEAR